MSYREYEIRTTNKKGLVCFKGMYKGERVIAIMKGKDCSRCIDYMTPDEFLKEINTGPYINIDNLII